MHSKNYLKIRSTARKFNIPLSKGEGFSCRAMGVCAVLLKCSSHFASYSLYGSDCYFCFRQGLFNFLIYVFISIIKEVLWLFSAFCMFNSKLWHATAPVWAVAAGNSVQLACSPQVCKGSGVTKIQTLQWNKWKKMLIETNWCCLILTLWLLPVTAQYFCIILALYSWVVWQGFGVTAQVSKFGSLMSNHGSPGWRVQCSLPVSEM